MSPEPAMQARSAFVLPARHGAPPPFARAWPWVVAMFVCAPASAMSRGSGPLTTGWGAPLLPDSQQISFARPAWRHAAPVAPVPVAAPPQPCNIFTHTPSFCERYSTQLIAFTAIFVVVLAFALSWQGQRFRRLYPHEDAPHDHATPAEGAKLANVGETASIVHEINQPLGAIMANADAAALMLNRRNTQDQELSAILKDIRNDSLRASQIIQKLRALLSKRSLKAVSLSLNDVVATSMSQLENLAVRHDTTLRVQLTEDLPAVMGDNTHLQQVLFNLAANGMEAMGELPTPERVLRISTSKDDKGHVIAAISDRGPGISAEALPYLFESFYTTKPEGMGMGLAIVRSIVDAHHGTIEVVNNPGGGATFKVVLMSA
jgi:signal transduction histidine kinase